MFPNTGEYHYEGRMHEQVRRVDGKPCSHVKAPQIVINHYGYTGTKNDEKGKVERNISLLKAQIQDNPEYPFYYYNLMNCYVVDGRFKEALEVFKDLKKREHIAIVNGCPVSYLPDAYKLASISYFELKDFENALKFALDGLEMLPDSPGLCYSAGLALFAMNNFELALRYADKAIEYKKNATVETLHDPSASSWKAKKIKGLALANMRRFKEAKIILEEAMNEIPIPDPVLISAYNSVCKAV
jgi:pentatricopeptide repeat protein